MSWGNEENPDAEPQGDTAPLQGSQGVEEVRLVDLEELNLEWSGWLAGVDYTASIRRARMGAAVLRGMLRQVRRRGSRARVQPLCTSLGEPVVRADLHPDGWREIADLVADGMRYRRQRE